MKRFISLAKMAHVKALAVTLCIASTSVAAQEDKINDNYRIKFMSSTIFTNDALLLAHDQVIDNALQTNNVSNASLTNQELYLEPRDSKENTTKIDWQLYSSQTYHF